MVILVIYSPLKAITGSSFAARLAGFNPKKIPVITLKINETKQAFIFMTNTCFCIYSTHRLMIMPIITPIIPPIRVMLADSTRNCCLISDGEAPSAFQIPISCFRSVTVTIMMFIIPIPPTKREMAAIALNIMLIVFVISLI